MRALLAMLPAVVLASACAAEIGDECSYDVDCSDNLDRTCDGSQPSGYCLIIGCDPDDCPSEAVCVRFTTPCPEGTSDETCGRIEPNRTRDYCLRHCGGDGDCRSGYACVSPDDLYAEIIDLDPSGSKICVPEPDV